MLRTMCFALLSVLLVGCASEAPKPNTIVQTVTVEPNIPIQRRPTAVTMRDVQFFVVTEANIGYFKEEFLQNNEQLVFVAISIDDYEDLALNLADLQRFIDQQGSVLVYYENAVSE
jgi:uncharacterized protein YcfL